MDRRDEEFQSRELARELQDSHRELERVRLGLEASEARLSDLIASAMDAIIAADGEFRIVLFNPAAARMFGCTADTALGRVIDDFIPAGVRERHRGLMQSFATEVHAIQAKGPREVTALRADGSEFPIEASVSVAQTAHGRLYTVFARDISQFRQAQTQAESRVRRLNRVYAVLSGINHLIIHARDRQELFREACRIAVEDGCFSKAWIGFVEDEGEPLRVVAWSGADDDYMERLARRLAENPEEKTGAIAAALRADEPLICNDVASDPRIVGPERLLAAGTRSLALFQLRMGDRNVGLISLHAPAAGFFDEEETRLLRSLAADISYALEHQYKSEQLQYLSSHDPATDLPNRRQFLDRLGKCLAEDGREHSLSAVVLMDLVRFRHINESLGREAGDQVLRQIAARLRATSPTAARLGSDVFALRIGDQDSLVGIAAEVHKLMVGFCDVPYEVEGTDLRTGCRFGVAVHPRDGDDAETLVGRAETALRRAKESSSSLVFYAPDMTAAANELLTLHNRLRRAVDNQEFVLHYQPKIRLRDSRVCGAEALLRWQDPEHGLVPPLKFIPMLEETGLIDAVGRWAMHQAMTDRQAWIDAGAQQLSIAVNLSPLQLNQPDFAEQVAEVATGPGDEALELEVTESVIMADVERKVAILEQVRAKGVSIAVDDFGTGYSSLAYIAKLPITALKIDRSFVNEIGASPAGYTLVSSIIALAHALHLKVVAEGVETQEQAQLLRLLSCDEAQGFLYSRPLPAAQFLEMLMR